MKPQTCNSMNSAMGVSLKYLFKKCNNSYISCTLPLSHFIIAFYDIISHILWLYRKQYNDFISFQWALPLISLQRKRSRWVPLFYKQELFIVMLGNKKMASKIKRQSLFKDVKLTRPQLKQLEFLKNLILIGKNTLCEDLSLS